MFTKAEERKKWKEWDIPAIQARAGADIPRDFPRVQPEEYLHLPELGWQE